MDKFKIIAFIAITITIISIISTLPVYDISVGDVDQYAGEQSVRSIVISDYSVDSINYTIYTDMTATVTGTTGTITGIPISITYQEQNYTVTVVGSGSCIGKTNVVGTVENPFIVSDTVKKISDNAFLSCSNLGAISIGSGVETIGSQAFYGTPLSSVTYSGNQLRTIGDSAFRECHNYLMIIIPDSVVSIGSMAFSTVVGTSTSSATVDIGSGLKNVGDNAFCNRLIISFKVDSNNETYYSMDGVLYSDDDSYVTLVMFPINSSVTSFTVPANVDVLGKYCFGGTYSKLTSISFADGSQLSVIDEYALYQLSNITVLTIPSKVTEIGNYAVAETGLTNLEFANDGAVEITIGDYAFCGENITTVSFEPDCKIISIGDYAFAYGSGLSTGSISDKDIKLTKFGSIDGTIEIPSSVSIIGNYAFGSKSLTDTHCLTINKIEFLSSSSVVSIGERAFSFINPTIIDLSACSNLVTIGDYAFNMVFSTAPSSITLSFPTSGKISVVGESAFSSSKQPTEYKINLPVSVKIVQKNAFKNCTSVTFSKGSLLEEVYSTAFYGVEDLDMSYCTHLKIVKTLSMKLLTPGSLILPEGLLLTSNLSNSDFKYIQVPSSTVDGDETQYSIKYGTVGNKDQLQSITIYSYTKAIPVDRITGAIISITATGTNDKFVVEDGILYLVLERSGNDITRSILVKAQSDITDVIIPSHVVQIYSNAFSGCASLKSVKIVGSNVLINDNAFKGCTALEKVITGSDPTLIDVDAFTDCGSITFYIPPESGLDNIEGYSFFGDYANGIAVSETVIYVASNVPLATYSFDNSVFTVQFNDGYSTYDVDVDVSSNVIESSTVGMTGTYAITVSGSEMFINIIEKTRDNGTVKITFDANGGLFEGSIAEYTLNLPAGLTIIDTDIPYVYKNLCAVTWYCGQNEYDFDSQISEDISLVAGWTERNPQVIFSSENSTVKAEVNDSNIVSGELISSGTNVIFTAVPNLNYEFKNWIVFVNGEEIISYVTSLQIEIINDTEVKAVCIYYSLSDGLSSITESDSAPKYSEVVNEDGTSNLVMQWTVGGYVDIGMTTWTGGVSVPLIVDDYVYIRVMDNIYKVESDTGYVVASVPSVTSIGYYHTLGYGEGCIIDYTTNNVFDLNLNKIFVLSQSINAAFFNEGYFYTTVDGTLYKFSSVDENTSSADEVKALVPMCNLSASVLTSYGMSSEPVFVDGCMYCLVADGNSRMIISVNLKTNDTISIVLTDLAGCLFDDGWLTYYNGRIYVTSYTVGLFGARSASGDAMITSVKVENGVMSDIKYTTVAAGAVSIQTILSKFVIYEGRGYLNASSVDSAGYLIVYNVKDNGDLEEVYYEDSKSSHGSIVVNTSESSVSNGNRVTIYLLPYSNINQIYVFTDNVYKTNASGAKIITTDGADIQYNSQAVRIGNDGQLIWYNDSGQLFSFTLETQNEYYFFIKDGDDAIWVSGSGSTPAEALENTGYATISADGVLQGANTVSADADTEGWSVYALIDPMDKSISDYEVGTYEWTLIENNNMAGSDTVGIHYWVITKDHTFAVLDSVWSYGDGNVYEFEDNVGTRSIIGTSLEIAYAISKETTSDGIFTVSATSAASGTMITIAPSPAEKYQVATVSYTLVGGSANAVDLVDGKYTFIMPDSDVTVNVTFEQISVIQYKVSKGIETNGTFTVSATSAASGTTISIAPSPAEKYQVATVSYTLVGGSANAVDLVDGKYTFIMPDSDVTVNVTFEQMPVSSIEYKISCTSSTSDSNTILNLTVSRLSGISDIENARFLVVAEYDGGIFVNVYSKIDLSNGSATEQVHVSTSGLESVSVQIVSGIPSGIFNDYGDYMYSVQA